MNLTTYDKTIIVTGLDSPEDGACNSEGQVYFAQGLAGRITRFGRDGSNQETVLASSTLHPEGLSFDVSGNLFFNTRDASDGAVWSIPGGVPGNPPTPATAVFSTFGEGTVFDSNGDLLAVDNLGGRVLRFSPPFSGTNAGTLFASGAPYWAGIAVSAAGEVFVSAFLVPAILRFSAGGTYLGTVGSGLNEPYFMEFDSEGNLYVTDEDAGTLVKITLSGNQTVIASIPRIAGVAICKNVAVSSPPIADAGPDQVTVRNTVVTLNGSGSFDPDGDPIAFVWCQLGGPETVSILNGTSNLALFASTQLGFYTFNLTVVDNRSMSNYDWAMVTVVNRAPSADAGPDQVVFKNTLVTLTGGGSNDPDTDPLIFNWTQTSGPPFVTLVGANSAMPTFMAPMGTGASGTYTFQITAWDPSGANSSDSVDVNVTNRSPIADSGLDQSIVGKLNLILLDGSASTDPDGEPLAAFRWSAVGGPAPVILSNATAANASFVPLKSGVYAFHLAVWDPDNASGEDDVAVTVWSLAPVGLLTASQPRANPNVPITFNASASQDTDGVILTYLFQFGDGTNVTSLTPVVEHAYFSPGSYLATLTVTDDDGNKSAPVSLVVTANIPPVPVAVATPTSGTLATEFQFNGSNSWDPDGTVVNFTWDFGDGLQEYGAVVSHEYLQRAQFTATLTVRDSDGATTMDAVVATVQNRPPVADAGVDQESFLGDIVVLDGSASSDPDADALTYNWILISGPGAVNNEPTTIRSTFNAGVLGTFTFHLTVADGHGGTSTDTVVIFVRDRSRTDSGSPNWKPWVALAFTLGLAAMGGLAVRNPALDPVQRRQLLFAVTLPVVLLEAATGLISLVTGWFGIPPVLGLGTLVDLLILAGGCVLIRAAERRAKAQSLARHEP